MTIPVAGGTADATDVTRLISKSGGTLTISTGAVTATPNSGNSLFVIAAESGTTDDLDTINGLAAGEVVQLIADSGDTITLKDGTGNIDLPGDLALKDDKIVSLWYDGSNLRLIGGVWLLDEDDFASDSDEYGATQQSIAAYITANSPNTPGDASVFSAVNLIPDFPSIHNIDDAMSPWWTVDNDGTLHEVDCAGESIPEKYARCLKLTISADGGGADYAYPKKDFDDANEPLLDDNVTTVSAGAWVYQKSTDTAGTITLELYDIDGTQSLGSHTTTTQDSWIYLKVENKTYQDSMRWRVVHSENSAIVYFTEPTLNVGTSVIPWRPRGLIYEIQYHANVLFDNSPETTWTDITFSNASPLAAVLHVSGSIKAAASDATYFRPNGSSETGYGTTICVSSAHQGQHDYSQAWVPCDASQVIEYKTDNARDSVSASQQGQLVWES